MGRRSTKPEIALIMIGAPFGALILAITAFSDWFSTAELPIQTATVIFGLTIILLGLRSLVVYRERRIERKRQNDQFLLDFQWDTNISPIEFEVCCADYLKLRGWRADTTKASGDHGADVVATRMGISIVIQCKKYSKPVGSRAVQEAISGRAFHKADYAFVVSNQSYTNTAHDLASQTNILLLHFSALRHIDDLVGIPEFKERPDRESLRQGRSVRTCPACAVKLNLPSSRVGRVKCPACNSSHYMETYLIKSY